jgi:cytochrome c553
MILGATIMLQSVRIMALATVIMSAAESQLYAQSLSSSEFGEKEYLNSCASCHGIGGKGDGPVADSLRKRPADLTKLAETNKGVFPFARIYEVVDGGYTTMVHGPRRCRFGATSIRAR